MEGIFNFKLNSALKTLIEEDYIYTCICDKELELVLVCWIDENMNLKKECFDIKKAEANLVDGSWIKCN